MTTVSHREIRRTPERVALLRYLVEQGGSADSFLAVGPMPSGRSLWMMRNAGLITLRRRVRKPVLLSITKKGRAWQERAK